MGTKGWHLETSGRFPQISRINKDAEYKKVRRR